MKKNVLVIGTGTIGEPLIGLLAEYRKKINIDNVYFHKRTPLVDEIAKVNSLVSRGAKLVVDADRVDAFKELGHDVNCNLEKALKLSDVVIDCTPSGNENKEIFYLPLSEKKQNSKSKKQLFIAQGSEKGFGIPYAYGINDEALLKNESDFIQVVSCNTHNIASLVQTLSSDKFYNVVRGDFTCIRRANDISQQNGFIASPEVGTHRNGQYGTHHAKDACDLFATLHKHPDLFSSALKVNTQYMHIIRFNVEIKGFATDTDILNKFKNNKFTAITHKNLANKVFSFGRDHGYYGRIFNHTVIAIDSLSAKSYYGNTKVTGFCFTPQDGNSLLSSVAATLHFLHGEAYLDYMKEFDNYLFQQI
jgi:glyceraldehyde-3-phosphate dehydrogenase type II